jgi:VWFA-related protein
MKQAIALIAAAFVLAAQEPVEPPVIRVTTRLVEVSVVVHDKSGAPVSDLTRDDFRVFDRGKQQKVALFFRNASRRVQSPPAPPGIFTNRRHEGSEAAGGVTVFLLDGLNTRFMDQVQARKQFLRILSQIEPEDRIAVYALGTELRVVQDFSGNSRRLVEAVNRYRGENGFHVDMAYPDAPNTGMTDVDEMLKNALNVFSDRANVDRAIRTASALEAIADHVGPIPGRKNLIWITGSFPFVLNAYAPVMRQPGEPYRERRSFNLEFSRSTQALNNANIAVYPVDARGLVPGVPDGIDTLNRLAGQTGGKAFYDTNDIRGAIGTAMKDAETSYTLGFYPDSAALDGRYHELRVAANRKGLEVRSRKGYIASADAPAADSERETRIAEALWSPLEATGISLDARLESAGGGTMRVAIGIAGGDAAFVPEAAKWAGSFDLALVQHAGDGRRLGAVSKLFQIRLTQTQFGMARKSSLTLTSECERAPEAVELRLVVFDRTSGRLGSLTIPLR